MANRLYDKGRQGFLDGDISWRDDNIKCVLVDLADYTPDFANDEFLSAITANARVAIAGNLANKTSTAGVADADDVTFSTVVGDPTEALVCYQDSGLPATSRLIAYIDTATGIPVTPNGGDVTVQWDSGSNKIFKL